MTDVSTSLKRDTVVGVLRDACERLSKEHRLRLLIPQELDQRLRLSELGIDSISVAEIVDDMERQLGVDLPFPELMLSESVGEFVDIVCGAGD